jgi:trehalose 6-phosphate phosphatase
MQLDSSDVDILLDALRVRAPNELLMVIAFDGVLTSFDHDPDTACITPGQKTLLRRMADAPGVTLAIMSGRRVADLHSRADLGGDVFYIGLHGLEVVGPDYVDVHQDIINDCRGMFSALERWLAPVIRAMPGVRLENKEAAIALHTHDADPADVAWSRLLLLSRVVDLATLGRIRVLRGQDVIELLPNVECPRGAAIARIRDLVERWRHQRVFTLYVAADTLDDDAFAFVRTEGVCVAVGRRGRLGYHLATRDDVDRLIARLAGDRWAAAAHG